MVRQYFSVDGADSRSRMGIANHRVAGVGVEILENGAMRLMDISNSDMPELLWSLKADRLPTLPCP